MKLCGKKNQNILKQWCVRFLDQTIFHFKFKRVGGQDSDLKWGNYFWINIFYKLLTQLLETDPLIHIESSIMLLIYCGNVVHI